MRVSTMSAAAPTVALSAGSCGVLQVSAVDADEFRERLSKDGRVESVPGVPFHCRRSVRVQETVYETATRPRIATPSVGGPAYGLSFGSDTVAHRSVVAGAVCLSNAVVRETVLDDDVLCFVNGVHPFAGSGSLEVEFSPDQTLTKAKASVDDKSLATVVDGATKLFARGGSDTDADAAPQRYRIVLRRTLVAGGNDVPPPIPLDAVASDISFFVDPPGAKAASAAKTTKFDVKATVTEQDGS